MMTLNYIGAKGATLQLVGNKYFDISNIDGMTLFKSNVSSLTVGGVDGDTVNNVQGQPRQMVIDLTIKQSANVEQAKRYILQRIKVKEKGRLEWTQNNRTVVIAGTVTEIEMPRWTDNVVMQITMYCSVPYWEDEADAVQEISEITDLHYFTDNPYDMLYFPEEGIAFGAYNLLRNQTITNDGDVSVGMTITIYAVALVTNPIIYNADGDFFGIGYNTTQNNKNFALEPGDYITITTHRGNKSVTLNGTTSLMNKIKPKSAWLQLEPGENTFSVDSDDDNLQNMYFSLVFKRWYV